MSFVKRTCRSAAFFATVSLLSQTSYFAADWAKNSGFEKRLRQTILIKGKPVPRFSIAERMRYYNVPGVSVAIIEGCNVVETRGFGVVREKGLQVRSDTLFQAASITKPVTAFGSLRLVDQGKLSLDGDVRPALKTWTFPGSPLLNGHPVTLRRLLSHSAGLNVGGFAGFRVGSPLPSITQILDGLAPATNAPIRVHAVPGTQWKYSGGGFVIAQLLMTETARRPFPELMRDLVLTPVGMNDSNYQQPLSPMLAKRAAAGHLISGEIVPGGWHVYPELGAASLWTTPRDIARFLIAVMRAERGEPHALLSRATAKEMLTAQIAQRGLGVIVENKGKARSFSHGGTNEGFQALMVGHPETCQGAVVMANSDNGRPLINEIMRAVADTYRWPDPRASVEVDRIAITQATAVRFAGTYESKSRPDIKLHIAVDARGELSFWWTRNSGETRREALFAFTDGLFSPDSGIVLKAPSGAGVPAPALLYSIAFGESYEAIRVH